MVRKLSYLNTNWYGRSGDVLATALTTPATPRLPVETQGITAGKRAVMTQELMEQRPGPSGADLAFSVCEVGNVMDGSGSPIQQEGTSKGAYPVTKGNDQVKFVASLETDCRTKGRAFRFGVIICASILVASMVGFSTDVQAAPTELKSYKLKWTAPGDDGMTGIAQAYDLRYSTDSALLVNSFETATSVAGLPSPSPAGDLDSFTVVDLEDGTRYYFAIKTVDDAGNISGISNIVSAVGLALGVDDDQALPMDFSLGQNYPNPFNPSTTIRYSVPTNSHVRVIVYNIQGQTIATLVDGVKSAGQHEQIWNGESAGGSQVASGVYFYRLETSQYTETKKMVMLK